MKETHQFFDALFTHSKVNAILIMNKKGVIEQVNMAFTTAFGYSTEDLESKHFRLLFTEKDQVILKPEIELNQTQREGSSSDETYLVHKDGTPIWVTGETILIQTDDGTSLVKIIHNIHAQKQLERYLLHNSELLESLFESVQQSGLLLIDSSLKVIKMNEQFKRIFPTPAALCQGAKLQEIDPSFWGNDEIKSDLRNVIVNHAAINKEYLATRENNKFHRLHITSKTLTGEDGSNKQVLLMVKEES